MRILIMTHLYPPHFLGGYELKCRLHAEELARRGHDVSVLTSRWKVGKDTIEGKVYRLLRFQPVFLSLGTGKNAPDPLRIRRRYNQLRWASACRMNYDIAQRVMRLLEPDVAYVWGMAWVSINPVLAAQDQGIPIVYRLDDYWLADLRADLCLEVNPLKRRYRAAVIGLSDFSSVEVNHMLVVSRFVMNRYLEVGFPEQGMTVIPEGVPSRIILDSDHSPDLSNRDEGTVDLVFAGRLIPDKGPDIAIEALATLREQMAHRNVHLDIIGTGPNQYLKQLQEMTASLGLNDHVSFLGFLEHSEVLVRLAGYDALLVPSRWAEPLAGNIAEAMARRLPVIATDRGGTSEIISDGENGLIVPAGQPALIAGAVKRLVLDSALGQKIRHSALRTVRDNYTHERIMDRIEAYLQTVIQHGDRPPQ
jgi:glycogen(starch) synthase